MSAQAWDLIFLTRKSVLKTGSMERSGHFGGKQLSSIMGDVGSSVFEHLLKFYWGLKFRKCCVDFLNLNKFFSFKKVLFMRPLTSSNHTTNSLEYSFNCFGYQYLFPVVFYHIKVFFLLISLLIFSTWIQIISRGQKQQVWKRFTLLNPDLSNVRYIQQR